MKKRTMRDGIFLMGAVDWNRRLFDSLIPLPEGTSYNAYLVEGSEKTALIDTADPELEYVLLEQLEDVKKIDYIISLHTEQDHSGAIPTLLEKYPGARVVCSTKAKELLQDHLHIDGSVIDAMDDGQTLSLGNRTFTFIHTPWVHWPETMCAYLQEEKILFSCDFFGSHQATSDMFAGESPAVYEGAKRYYAEIMMPFRSIIRNNMKKLEGYEIGMIAPSHGPVFDKPEFILDAYRDWISDRVSNFVAIPYISMHGSTEIMVNHLLDALVERGVKVKKYELTVTDIGNLAIDLVDAATIVIGTPTVHFGPHPAVYSATHLANALRPKLKYAAIIGSYGWGTKAVEQISGLIPNLKAEVLGTVMCKGKPRAKDLAELDALADAIAEKHRAL
ncbi:MAG: FprA family A-type flavoprotein [Synergistaceae bacterium]|jgi:flavorubredoxin|uniref:FprA family A-type flavoprotein n=1 Tax=Aminivibrio sp. TaxID=1872489 RepID=UPI001D3B7448|nr:FprA family A-type flavoprotein [Synergistaceae bacterium]NCC56121.1 FprA family A-type flavoprotein [Synergistales bacterium]MDD3390119.1 FprA family A-type flavoprotein [Synergistaceae bacterium]MDD3690388.1 FprA family A-type flavoprotein [Synergistaceae bacterium]MDD4021846.1 FprA family A-type flavoprotein [Synergistaceae bacterium]